jgi:hypothetical protein
VKLTARSVANEETRPELDIMQSCGFRLLADIQPFWLVFSSAAVPAAQRFGDGPAERAARHRVSGYFLDRDIPQ